MIRLLEDPTLIQQELDRRLAAARASDPTKKREQGLQRELIQVGKGIERLLTAYQEGLLSIEQLRQRMPSLRNREQMLRSELQAIIDQINDRAAFLRLAETLTAFLSRLRSNADTLDVAGTPANRTSRGQRSPGGGKRYHDSAQYPHSFRPTVKRPFDFGRRPKLPFV